MKKILISGAMSGSGKTTVSSILMSAFENVAPFKVGPDYIDPGYHELFTGNKSHNLDAFMFDEDTLKHIFKTGVKGRNIAIVEGVMGLYDGIGHEKDNFSTAHISRILDIPVILVVNAKGISTSIAAEVLGFKLFDKNVKIKGIILNNVSSEKLYLNLKELRRKVGIIFQDPEIQIFAPLVFQEVAYGPENLGYSEKKVEESVNRAMKEINIEDLKDRPCHHLSYGQKKRVSIAAITAMEPELLILDEPTAWLDSKNTKRVSEILDNFSKAGKTMVVSTHDTDFAYEFADYIYVLDKGKIVRQGNRDEVFEDFEFLKKLNLNIPNVLKIKSYLKYKNLDENGYYKFLEEKNLL